MWECCGLNGENQNIQETTDEFLKEEYGFLHELGLEFLNDIDKYEIPEYVGRIYRGPYPGHFAAACQCFYLFRRIHEKVEAEPERATLLGDFFFSRFSHHLIPLDSTRLILRFSEYLKEQAAGGAGPRFCQSSYLAFLAELCEE